MPIIKSAIKRMKQTAKRTGRNQATKKDIKSAVKAFIEKPTAAGLSKAHSEIDTAVKKNLLPKNTAARRKANLVKVARAASIKPGAAATKKVAPKAKAVAAKPAAAKKPVAKAAPAKKPAAKTTATKKPATKKVAK